MTDATEAGESLQVAHDENWDVQWARGTTAKPSVSQQYRELLALYAGLLEKEGPGPHYTLFVRLVSYPVGRSTSRD